MTQQLFALVQAIWKTMQASQKNLAGIERQLTIANTIHLWELEPKTYTRRARSIRDAYTDADNDYANLLAAIKALPEE